MKTEIKNQYYYWQDSYFDKKAKKCRRRQRKSSTFFSFISSKSSSSSYFSNTNYNHCKHNYLILISLFICLLIFNESFLMNVNGQDELEFDLEEDPTTTTIRSTKPSRSRVSRTRTSSTASSSSSSSSSSSESSSTFSTSTTTKPPPQLTLAPKITPHSQHGSTTVSPSHHHNAHTTTPPYHYAHETLNKTHASLFKNWLEVKSVELYQLSMNYSGFKLLNQTYNLELREDAKFSWINFTEMIMEISNTISEVLYNKTLIVKNLSNSVENAFGNFTNNSRRIKESANHVYYDTKSPKTFCDVQELHNLRAAKQANLTATPEPTTKESFTTSSSSALSSTSSLASGAILLNSDLPTRTNAAGESIGLTTPNIDAAVPAQLLDPMKNLSDLNMYLKKSDFVENEDEIKFRFNVDYKLLEFDFVDKTEDENKIQPIQVSNNII